MKTLLVVAYYFPPAAVVGTHRILRFVRHLPSWGWRCAVITAREDCYDLIKESLQAEVGRNCAVYRTRAPEFHKTKRLYEPTEHGGMRELGVQPGITKRSLGLSFRRLTAIPDVKIGWLPFALAQSLAVLRSDEVDAILTTSFPYTAHLVGYALKQLTKKPWVADFRDPWAEYAFLYPGTSFHRRVAALLESCVIHAADMVIANTRVFHNSQFGELAH